ncbi:MAG: hypothetical protein AAGI53_13745 [Planctomycetota bacterium]
MPKKTTTSKPPARAARLIVPGVASLALHAGLLAGVLAVTVSVTSPGIDNALPLGEITVDLNVGAETPEPIAPPESRARPLPSPAVVAQTVEARVAGTSEAFTNEAAEAIANFQASTRLGASGPIGAGVSDSLARNVREGGASASFAGLSVRAANRIVYVVDASGAMVATLPFVIDELAFSIERLAPSQQFAVVLFGGGTRTPPGSGPPEAPRLRAATPDAKRQVIAWAKDAMPKGPSDPLDGLEPALRAEPDLVFLLARSIRRSRTGAQWGVGRPETLRTLDALNPRDDRSGRRPAVIKTVQFIEADPTGLMEAVAGLHGDGAGDTRVITADELRRLASDDRPDTPAIDLTDDAPDQIGPALADAIAGLGDAERTGAALRTLYGLPTNDERNETDRAATIALREIEADPALAEDEERVAAAKGRALLLMAAATRDDDRAALARRVLETLGPERPALDTPSLARELTRATAHRLLDDPETAQVLLATVLASPLREGLLRGLAGEIELERAAQARPAGKAPRPPATRPYFDDVSRTVDPGWALLFAEAATTARLGNSPPADTIAPLMDLLQRRDVLRTDRERKGLVYPRLAIAVETIARSGDNALDALPLEAVYAAALIAEREDRLPRTIALLQKISEREPTSRSETDLPGDALRDLARLSRHTDPSASALLLARLAAEHPEHPDASTAIAAAIEDASEADRPRLLALGLDRFGDHPLVDAWRVMLGGIQADAAAFELLDQVSPASPWRRDADELVLSIVDQLIAGQPEPPTTLLRRSVEVADTLARGDTPTRRARLADRLIASEPAEAESIFASLLAAGFPVPGGPDRLSLGRAQSLAALGRDIEAGTILRDLVARLDQASLVDPSARDGVFWGANTLWLELIEANADRDAAIAAHLTNLGLADRDLGGEPWRSRLEALAERVAPANHPVDGP